MSGPVLVITDAEMEVLYEMHHLDYVVYLWLRRYMDYGTGIVGITRGVSRQMLLERCHVPETRGRGQRSITVDALRESLDRLIRAGLLARHGNGQKLVFLMPMAYTGKLRSKELPPRNPRETPDHLPPELDPAYDQYWCGFSGDLPPELPPRNPRPQNTELPPTSGNQEIKENNQSSSPCTENVAREADGALSDDDDSVIADIPDTPTQPLQWVRWFNHRYQTGYSPVDFRDRKALWPVFNRWCQAGVTISRCEEAIRRAQDNARAPIVSLPMYVDRMLSSEAVERSKSGFARMEARRSTLNGLIGKAAPPNIQETGYVIDASAPGFD